MLDGLEHLKDKHQTYHLSLSCKNIVQSIHGDWKIKNFEFVTRNASTNHIHII